MKGLPILKGVVLEKHIEDYLVKRVKGCGGEAQKFTSPNRVNVPDRIVLVPRPLKASYVVFVEVKRPGGECTSGQRREQDKLLKMGFAVYVLDSKPAVDGFIKAEFGK